MEFIQTNPFAPFDKPPADIVEQERLIKECAARPGGHSWAVEGIPGEPPSLTCTHCPGTGYNIYPDIIDVLYGEHELGGRTILFGQELPDDDSSTFNIPVDVDVEYSRYTSMDSIGYEYDVEIRITDRDPAA